MRKNAGKKPGTGPGFVRYWLRAVGVDRGPSWCLAAP